MAHSQVKQINIMISSTRADLTQYRNEASQIIRDVALERERQVQLIEVSMEKETQSGRRESAVAVSRRWVEQADWVLVFVGWNYGTISNEEGYNGLSVTEWEYERAVELGKEVFVFIAGEPGTPNQYDRCAEEIHDLKNWYFQQTDTQRKKLEAFKQKLAGKHVEMFENLQVFRKRLEKTLKDAIDKSLINDPHPPDPLRSQLLTLVHLMMPYIRDGILKVTLINHCKQIHDYLHELLQHVIRPLREEKMPKWKEEGTLSYSGQIFILKRMNKASVQVGGIKAVRAILRSNDPDDSELESYKILVKYFNKSVDNVVKRFESWDQETDSPEFFDNLATFTDNLDEFAMAVQEAFSIADQRMTKEESDLRELYVELRQGLRQTRQECNLAPCDNERLEEELLEVAGNREGVHKALTNHHAWQKIHDKLHQLDSYRDTDLFAKELNRYRENSLSIRALPLINRELRKAEDLLESKTAAEQKVCIRADQPDALSCPSMCGLFVDNLTRLRDGFEVLRDEGGLTAFDRIQSPFDDAFYCVDKRTLVEVSRAGMRAKKLEQWLDTLCKPGQDD